MELKLSVQKAEEKVNKIMATIEKHKKTALKKLTFILDKGWELDRYLYAGGKNSEAYWAICDYDGKLEDIEGATRKLRDAKIVLANWEEKYRKQVELETIIATEMPAIFNQCKDELADIWTKDDIRRREVMLEQHRTLSYEEFRKLYRYSEQDALCKTEEEFHKIELKEAEVFIIDLYNRVKAITGEVTDWKNIYYKGTCLNGWVKGENGVAEVETILAGGYNIQRLHMRVLVKTR